MPTIAPERQIYADLLVGRPDGVTWESLREYLASATVELGDISGVGTGQSGVDGVVRRASFVLRNDRASMPGDSFSPRDRDSAWNRFDVDGDGTPEYAPLLWPNREVVLRVRIDGPVGQGTTSGVDDLGMADGATSVFALSVRPVAEDSETVTFKLPYRWTDYADNTWAELTDRTWVDIKEEQGLARGVDYTIDYEAGTIAFATTPEAGVFIEAEYGYWATLFHGLLGDAIRTSGPTVECDARDLAKRLQDTYILTPREYGSEAGTPAETVIQQIIDDNLGAGEVTLYFPSGTASDPRPIAESPGFMVVPYVVEYMSVWDAIQQVAAQFGWFLGYRWHPNTGRMQLILMEPPRNKDASTADFHFSWEDDIYTQDLEITDRDIRNIVTVTYRNAATDGRESVTVKDDTSIATYGPRAMQIEEGDASLIDTPEEAERLANAALADLKDMTATTQIQMPLLPTLDVFSGIVVTDPRLSSTDDFFGVESVRHVLNFEARQFRTEAVAAGRVIGGHHRWLQMQTRPGAAGKPVHGREIEPGSIRDDRIIGTLTTWKQLVAPLIKFDSGAEAYTVSSIAIDPDQNLQVVFANQSTAKLMCAKMRRSGEVLIAPKELFSGRFPAITVDSEGNVHVGFQASDDPADRPIRYAKLDGAGNTLISPVDMWTPDNGDDAFKFCNLAVDGTDHIHWTFQGYPNECSIWYAKSDKMGNAMTSPTKLFTATDSTLTKFAQPEIAVDGDGNLHFTWYDTDGSQSSSWLPVKGSGIWHAKVSPSLQILVGPKKLFTHERGFGDNAMVIDALDNVHLLFRDGDLQDLWYARLRKDGSVSSAPYVRFASGTDVRYEHPAIASDLSSNLYFTWYSRTIGDIWFAVFKAMTFTRDQLERILFELTP